MIGSPAFLFVIVDFFDTFANEADRILAIILMVMSKTNRLRLYGQVYITQ